MLVKVHDILLRQVWGAPLWVLLLAFVGLPLLNEIAQRSKGTRAESLLQGIALFLLKLPVIGVALAKFPVVGDALYIFAPKDKQGLPTPLIAKPMTVVVPAVEVTINPPLEASKEDSSER
jgi:hypothetical protein